MNVYTLVPCLYLGKIALKRLLALSIAAWLFRNSDRFLRASQDPGKKQCLERMGK